MKVLVVTPAYHPATRYGGVVSMLGTLCSALAKLRISVTVYTTNASGTAEPLDVPLGQCVNVDGANVYYFQSTFGARWNFHSRGLSNMLRRTAQEFDLVYIAALWQWIGVDAARICEAMDIPVIHGIHGGFSERVSRHSYKKRIFKSLFLNRALRSAVGIHLSSEHERKTAGNWVSGLPTLLVPNPVDANKYRPRPGMPEELRRRYGIPSNAYLLISVGRPDGIKNIDLLIGALKKSADWHLLFVGEDDCGAAPEWKKYARAIGVADRVSWAGFLQQDELTFALSVADLFALVSESENFGMVAVEAMLCGLPVMLSTEVGVLDSIKDEAFAIAVETSTDSIAEALLKFQMSRRKTDFDRNYIRSVAIEKFSPEVIAENFVTKARTLIAARKAVVS